jgi:dipeptide transport system permease protein
MLRFFLYRLALVIPTFIGVSIVAFAFIRLLPGDPILLLAGERGMTAERYQQLQALYGFDKPLIIQYFNYVAGILQGDLGTSLVTKRPVLHEFFALFPATRNCPSAPSSSRSPSAFRRACSLR